MNKPLIMETLKVIEANLDKWDQDAFADRNECGTTMCFAGWSLALSGYTLDKQLNFLDRHGNKMSWSRVEHAAQEHLGLSDEQVESIFYFFPYGTDPKRKKFEDFRDHVLAVAGLTDES